jgi:hypothetical protein
MLAWETLLISHFQRSCASPRGPHMGDTGHNIHNKIVGTWFAMQSMRFINA